MIPERVVAEFSYDVLGRRISKTTRHSELVSESSILYIYSGDQILQETETKDGIEKTKEYVYGNGGVDNVNLYGYVGNNPVNAVDPSGLMAKAAIMEAGDFIGITDASEGLGNVAAFWMGYATDDKVLMSEGEAGMRDSLGKLTNPVAFAMNRLNKMKKVGGVAMGLFGKKTEKTGEEAVKNRVYIRKSVKEEIFKNTKRTSDGKMIDNNTRKPIDGPYDIGHLPGEEWRVRKQRHIEQGSTRREVIEAENNPTLYQIEDRTSNRSHRFER